MRIEMAEDLILGQKYQIWRYTHTDSDVVGTGWKVYKLIQVTNHDLYRFQPINGGKVYCLCKQRVNELIRQGELK